MTDMVLRPRTILVSDELWKRIERAAQVESRQRGCEVLAADWICDQLDAALFLFVEWDEPTGDLN